MTDQLPAAPTDPTSPTRQRRGSVNRRRMLAAGVPALVAPALLPRVAHADPVAPAHRPDSAVSSLIVTTVAEIRGLPAVAPDAIYYVTDPGAEGVFRPDPVDTASDDNTGTILVTAAAERVKRAFTAR